MQKRNRVCSMLLILAMSLLFIGIAMTAAGCQKSSIVYVPDSERVDFNEPNTVTIDRGYFMELISGYYWAVQHGY